MNEKHRSNIETKLKEIDGKIEDMTTNRSNRHLLISVIRYI